MKRTRTKIQNRPKKTLNFSRIAKEQHPSHINISKSKQPILEKRWKISNKEKRKKEKRNYITIRGKNSKNGMGPHHYMNHNFPEMYGSA
ncbi:hypothetical protein CDL12_14467 [Handroanthus impetiginosus]|uniref:Uncharacterized protein n=1 Tax=Handroanthus impetiginosus TaxID=429701 RepID=A0A2G9H5X8_9LAMI|nr:hypothetical protein CDL12_14467 [Handroanthus impetiginosus]